MSISKLASTIGINAMNQKWDRRFLNRAVEVANWSKDPSTPVGAVIVDGKHQVSEGFNGFPAGIRDDDTIPREEKLRRTIHAEENALLFAGRGVAGCTIYVTHPPCGPCAAKLIQAGIARVVYLAPSDEFVVRWHQEMASATAMFEEAGVRVEVPEGLFLWEGA